MAAIAAITSAPQLPYTEPGRIRPAPQVMNVCRGGTRSPLDLSSAGVGNDIGLVPDARPHGCSGLLRRHSRVRIRTFLLVEATSGSRRDDD